MECCVPEKSLDVYVNCVPDGYCFLLYIGTRLKLDIPEIPDGYEYGDRFRKPNEYGYGYGMIFENGYGYGYRRTRPELAPRPFLIPPKKKNSSASLSLLSPR